jgi:protein-S-isoprenylcysteine O-methyltransferase Ste14
MKYFILCTLWILWCFLHSYLVTTRTTTWFKKHLGKKFAFYRISYNLFSLITVLPLFYWQRTIAGPTVIPLSPFLMIFKYIALIFGVIVIAGSFVSFDIWKFTGIRKRVSGDQQKEKDPVIKKHGFYGIVRHPMYLGGIIFFTASMTDAPLPAFLGYLILAIYMIIGTVREDRRLSRELGDVYRNYQKEVPMILPGIPWRKT